MSWLSHCSFPLFLKACTLQQVGGVLLLIDEFKNRQLYQLCIKNGLDGVISNVSDKVNLITPENILVNAVMFEPVVDMAMNHLME